MKHVVILGYYGKKNLGDDLFEVAFKAIFDRMPDVEATLVPPNKIDRLSPDTDALICGGGDIVTDYFMDKIISLKKKYQEDTSRTLPVYAVSIGLSFPESISDSRCHPLDIFDHIIFRNKADYSLTTDRYGPERTTYMPDLVFALPELLGCKPTIDLCPPRKPILLACLAQPMSADDRNPHYPAIVDKITGVLQKVQDSYDIILMSFNTMTIMPHECDIVLNERIAANLTNPVLLNEDDPTKVFGLFYRSSVVLAMRFHAHVLAIATQRPLVSLSMTNKTEAIMIDQGLEKNMIVMQKDNPKEHYPTDFNDVALLDLLRLGSDGLQRPTAPVIDDPSSYISHALEGAQNTTAPFYVPKSTIETIVTKTFTLVAEAVCKIAEVPFDASVHIPLIRRTKTLNRFHYALVRTKPSAEHEDKLVSLIEMAITGSDYTDYRYGLTEQLWNLNLQEGVEWIVNRIALTDRLPEAPSMTEFTIASFIESIQQSDLVLPAFQEGELTTFTPTTKVRLNMGYIPQKVAGGYHRSGWRYVTDHLTTHFHDPTAPIIFDGYVDKTFHWSRDFCSEFGIIPYKKAWVGFVHHTPNEQYSAYNTVRLISDPLFLESLPLCKALLVMSDYLKDWFLQIFPELPVYNICHPTLIVDKTFDVSAFLEKQPLQIVQIGGWLRDPYAVYSLPVYNKNIPIQKYALKGKGMENYFPRDTDQISLQLADGSSTDLSSGSVTCLTPNKYYIGLIRNIHRNRDSVEVIETLSDEEFDDLLSSSMVFLYLEDASASNTVIECVVRNTPLLVNRIPAIVEVLGEEYPLFYDTIAHAGQLASDLSSIVNAHLYLRNLDKTPFYIDTFLSEFQKILDGLSSSQ